MCILFRKFELASYIGRKVYDEDFVHTYNVYSAKIFIEANIDFNIMTLLSINSWVVYPKKYFWKTIWNAVASTGTIATSIALICYPIYGTVGIYRNRHNLNDEEILKQYGVLYDEQRYQNIHQALFSIYGIYRRIFMVTIFIVFERYPYFQIAFLTVLSFMNWVYITTIKPFNTVKENKLEFIGEMIIYLIVWSNICF